MPPEYDGELPPYGFHIVHRRTYGVRFVLRGVRDPDGSSDDAVGGQRGARI